MRRVRRKGGNKVFGCDLLVHLNASSQEIPQVLRCCSEFVETHGVVDGIYRLSGVSSNTQKLRTEFECDGSPDLNKELYLQDIHCVSSLCKAYFRELPNPLLTYQLYDKFAEAVSTQLEEETLEKIRDVLRELPAPHYRTLEFLMRHLDRMASCSSETNMHARNLAIVWAPNLLRSKEIEVSGLNGKTAFMEVRVQSIVVEFILTHIAQLFPEPDVSYERRTSLPSPSAACNQEEGFLKSTSTQHTPSFGKLSPIRSRHAIIEGTDKRKGSLKGRKWMSIFNIGGRFHDRRHKHSSKEKDRPALRPARSMDSLSTPLYPKEGSLRTDHIPPSTSTTSPLVTPSPPSGSDVTVSSGGPISGSEYAVTYRRGTGLVSGGLGTQGIYTPLHPEGFGVTGNETFQLRSPGLTTKGRRAAVHITRPTMVTVPLHITSNLALGVLQGGGGDRIIHCGRDKDEGDSVEGKREGESMMREGRRMEWNVDDCRRGEESNKHRGEVADREVVDTEGKTVECGDGGDNHKRQKEEQKEDDGEEWRWKPEQETGGQCREQRVKSLTSSPEEDNDEDGVSDGMDVDERDDYMDMEGPRPADRHAEVNQCRDDLEFDASNIFNSTEVDDLGLSGYVQDNFEFLDQMDCSTLDHLDYSVPYQVNEFSVEPPCHSDDEYEVMARVQASDPAELRTHPHSGPQAQTQSPAEPNPKRLLSVESQSRHSKSLSLPHMTSPVHGPEESYFEEEAEDDSDDNDYSSEDDESLFVKSLPTDFILNSFCRFEPGTDEQDRWGLDGSPVQQLQISGGRECQTECCEFPARKESTAGDQEQMEVKAKEDEDRPEEKKLTKTKEENYICEGKDQPENKSRATEEDEHAVEDTQNDKIQPPSLEESTHVCAEYPLPANDDSSTAADMKVEEDVVDNKHSDYQPHCAVSCGQKEITDSPFQGSRDFAVSSREQTTTCDREDIDIRDSKEGEDMKTLQVTEDISQGIILEITDNDQNIWEETTEDGSDETAGIEPEEKLEECGTERDAATCRTSGEICHEHEDVIGEAIEEVESKQAEKKVTTESVSGEEGTVKHVTIGEEEQIINVSGDETAGEGATKETHVRMRVVEESLEAIEEHLPDTNMQQRFEEKEATLEKTNEVAEAIQGEAQYYVVSKENESKDKEKVSEQQSEQPSVALITSSVKEVKGGRKPEERNIIQGGIGRKLVISKHPKIFQVKAVPVVPPKPMHCKLTAMTIQQQLLQRERRDGDRWKENLAKAATDHDTVYAEDPGRDGEEARGPTEKPPLKGGEREREKMRDGEERATSRSSPLSMCFDEAVAIAAMRREKEKECEKERQREWGNEVQ